MNARHALAVGAVGAGALRGRTLRDQTFGGAILRGGILIIATLLSGCAQMDYLMQSAQGQWALMASRVPIASLIADPATPVALSARLREVQTVRAFARDELALPDSGSYQHYVDLGRDHVVYTVVAAPPLSLQPRRWCYPVVGCVSYRGWFALQRAADDAERLRAQGDDVYVAPVQAYSTLGWFDDPVISPLIGGPGWYTASVIFHELAHQKLYVANDTAFNEAYAVAVQREGERRWIAAHGNADDRAQHARYIEAQRSFLQLVNNTRRQLQDLYASTRSDADKRQQKQALFTAMRAEFVDLRAAWGGYRGFDRWFAQDLNNAKMALVATYQDLVPRFARLLDEVEGDMTAFHARVAVLGELDRQARRDALPAAR